MTTDQEAHDLLYAKGVKALEAMGATPPDKGASEWSAPIKRAVVESAIGSLWTREGLGRRDRSLCVISILAALGKQNQLRAHVKFGLVNGLTPEEIREALLHTTFYCGAPAGLEATGTADTVIQEWLEGKSK